MADLQDQFRLKALGHQADNLGAKLDSYKALTDEDLLYKYSRVSYLFERAVERMEPSESFMDDMNLMRVVLLDRMSERRILRQERVIDLANTSPDTNNSSSNPQEGDNG